MVTESMETPQSPNAGAKLDRRKRVFYVPENYVLQLLSRGLAKHNVIMVPEPLGLPDTASVVGVWSDWSRNAFAVVVHDQSFDDVPDGEVIPEIKIDWSYAHLAIKDSGTATSAANFRRTPQVNREFTLEE